MVPIDCKACMGKFCVEHRGTVEHGCEERKENLRNSYQERWFRKGKTGGERVNGNGSPKVGSSTSNLGTDIKSKFGKLNLGGVSSLTSSNGSSSNSNSTPMNKTSTPTPQKTTNQLLNLSISWTRVISGCQNLFLEFQELRRKRERKRESFLPIFPSLL